MNLVGEGILPLFMDVGIFLPGVSYPPVCLLDAQVQMAYWT